MCGSPPQAAKILVYNGILKEKSKLFPPHSETPWGEILDISPPNGGETLRFWSRISLPFGEKQRKILYFDSKFAFWYCFHFPNVSHIVGTPISEFQNFRLRRYLEIIFLIVVQNQARLRRLLSPYVNSTMTNIR